MCDLDGHIVKDPNRRVQEAIALVFKKFTELGSIRQTYRWFNDERIELPVNQTVGGRFELTWKLPANSFIADMLHNPLYAGAYVYGRRPIEVVIKDGQPVKRQASPRAPEQAKVFIQDHHEGYIDWAHYQRSQATMRGNGATFERDESTGAVRAGHGLLSGLLRCGRCGRKLHVRYWGKAGTAARYLCNGDFPTGGRYCLGFGGANVDRRVSEELLSVLSPLGIKASLRAIDTLSASHSDRHHALARQLQQLEYETQRAFEQYDQVDPANRLAADELERRWNEKLQAREQLNAELRNEQVETSPLNDDQRDAIVALGTDFNTVWAHPHCPAVLKKKIARTLIEEIVVNLDDETQVLKFLIHWYGGTHTRLTMPKPMSGAVAHKTSLDDIELITKMAQRYRDDQIARVLSKLGRRTGKGNRWTRARVAYARKKYNIPSGKPAPTDPVLTLGQAMQYCGVSNSTLMRLIRAKVLAAEQVAPYAPLEIKREALDTEPVSGILSHLKMTGKLILPGDTLDQQPSLFQQNQ